MKGKNEKLFDGSVKESEVSMRKPCVRFQKDGIPERDVNDAVAYLSLRGTGCPRKEAILFAAKSNCRVDTTKSKDGPSEFRNLKQFKAPSYLVEEGWLYGQPDYQLSQCLPSRNQLTSGDTQNDERMEDNFRNEETEMRKEYSAMVQRMKNYVHEISYKYKDLQTKTDVADTVRRISNGVKYELQHRHRLSLKNVQFYEIAEQIVQYRKDLLQNKSSLSERNLVDYLNVFKTYENDPELGTMPIYKYGGEDEDNIEVFADEINRGNNISAGAASSTTGGNAAIKGNADGSQEKDSQSVVANASSNVQNNINNSQSVNNAATTQFVDPYIDLSTGRMGRRAMRQIESRILFAQQLSSLESVAMLLEQFEKGEDQEQEAQASRFDRHDESQQQAKQEQMRQILQAVRQENATGLESQFNSQKYFFAKDFKPKENLEKEERERQELINFIIQKYAPENIPYKLSQLQQQQQQQQQFGEVDESDKQGIEAMKEHQDRYQKNFQSKIISHKKIKELRPHIPRLSISSHGVKTPYSECAANRYGYTASSTYLNSDSTQTREGTSVQLGSQQQQQQQSNQFAKSRKVCSPTVSLFEGNTQNMNSTQSTKFFKSSILSSPTQANTSQKTLKNSMIFGSTTSATKQSIESEIHPLKRLDNSKKNGLLLSQYDFKGGKSSAGNPSELIGIRTQNDFNFARNNRSQMVKTSNSMNKSVSWRQQQSQQQQQYQPSHKNNSNNKTDLGGMLLLGNKSSSNFEGNVGTSLQSKSLSCSNAQLMKEQNQQQAFTQSKKRPSIQDIKQGGTFTNQLPFFKAPEKTSKRVLISAASKS